MKCWVIRCVAVCVAVCCSVCCSVLQCVAVRCSGVLRVQVCCSGLQWVAVGCSEVSENKVCCSMLQCVAVGWQCPTATCSNMLQQTLTYCNTPVHTARGQAMLQSGIYSKYLPAVQWHVPSLQCLQSVFAVCLCSLSVQCVCAVCLCSVSL